MANNPWGYGVGYLPYDGAIIETGTLPGAWYGGYNVGMNLVHETGHWCAAVFRSDISESLNPKPGAWYSTLVLAKVCCTRPGTGALLLFAVMLWQHHCADTSTCSCDPRMRWLPDAACFNAGEPLGCWDQS